MKKYIMAILIRIMIIPIAILNGGFREYILVKLGILARPLSGIILSVCIFAVAYFLVPKIKKCVKRDYIIFGVIWFILTNLFDLVAYIKDGGGFADLLQSYNILTGNTWLIVVLTALFAPIVVMRIKAVKNRSFET
jgi:hypothetical protein